MHSDAGLEHEAFGKNKRNISKTIAIESQAIFTKVQTKAKAIVMLQWLVQIDQ